MSNTRDDKPLRYYVIMYRRAVLVTIMMAVISVLLVTFLLYCYVVSPERSFYASSTQYKVTRLIPIEKVKK